MENKITRKDIISDEELKAVVDEVHEAYKQVVEDYSRIKSHIKLAIQVKFDRERAKQRITDPDQNKVLLNHLGAALSVIESEISADVVAIIAGQSVYELYPELKETKHPSGIPQ